MRVGCSCFFRSRWCLWMWWWLIVAMVHNHKQVLSSSSTSSSSKSFSYNAYNYDLTTPQFTPDGQLLQVEYASEAATHSTPILIIPVVMSKICGKSQQQQSTAEAESPEEVLTSSPPNKDITNQVDFLVFITLKPSRSAQDRLIVLSPPFSTMNHNNNGQVVIAMSGIVADSVALLRNVQDAMQQDWKMYNGGTVKSSSIIMTSSSRNDRRRRRWGRSWRGSGHLASFIIRVMARTCHAPTMGGGIRPFGSTMVVCGWEPTTITTTSTGEVSKTNVKKISNSHQKLVLWQCHPSGAVQSLSQHLFQLRQDEYPIHIVGGDITDHGLLKRLVQQEMNTQLDDDGSDDNEVTDDNANVADGNHDERGNPIRSGLALRRVLRAAVRALIKHRERQQSSDVQQQQQQGEQGVVFPQGVDDNDMENKKVEVRLDNDLLSSSSSSSPLPIGLECIVMSAQHGVHRLTPSQVETLLRQCSTTRSAANQQPTSSTLQ